MICFLTKTRTQQCDLCRSPPISVGLPIVAFIFLLRVNHKTEIQQSKQLHSLCTYCKYKHKQKSGRKYATYFFFLLILSTV